MIVVCTTCQARFKVADDKIGPRGAKVRCSKCQTVFVVHRELGVLPPEPAPPAPPAAIPAAAPPSSPAQARSRGMELDLESEPMGGTRPSGLLADPFARAPAGGAPDPFAAAPAPPPVADPFAAPSAPSAHDPFGGADPFGASSAPVSPPADAASPFGAVDPFVATVASHSNGAPNSAVTDLSDLIGAPAPGGTPIPAPPPVEAPPEPSGILDSGFDFDPSAGHAPELVAPTPVPFQPPPPAPEPDLALAERTPASIPVPGAAPMPGSGDFGGFDPFSGAASQDFGGPDEDFAAQHGLVEPPPAPAPFAVPPPEPLETASEGLPAAATPAPVAPSSEGPEAEAVAGLRQRSSRVRAVAINAISLVALIVVAVGFLAVWRGGRLGAGGGLKALFGAPVEAPAPFATDRLRSGLYDRADAPPLLFVTGRAISHAVSVVPGLRVRVEVLSKGAVVAQGEARAGAVPTPEQIYGSKDATELAALLDQVAAGAPPSVKPGDALPFLVAISDYPRDVAGLGLRVDVEPMAPPAPTEPGSPAEPATAGAPAP